MDQGSTQHDQQKEDAKMTANDCKGFIEIMQRKYRFLRQVDKNFDTWDHYDATEVLVDFIAFLRNYDEN
jgi:hypothetical protein